MARAIGVEPAQYLIRAIDGFIEPAGLLPGESVLDGLKRIGVFGAFESVPREDGRYASLNLVR